MKVIKSNYMWLLQYLEDKVSWKIIGHLTWFSEMFHWGLSHRWKPLGSFPPSVPIQGSVWLDFWLGWTEKSFSKILYWSDFKPCLRFVTAKVEMFCLKKQFIVTLQQAGFHLIPVTQRDISRSCMFYCLCRGVLTWVCVCILQMLVQCSP